MQHIAIFGGSFDPIHLGHLLVAEAAREELRLTRLFFVPAAQSPFKPESNPAPAAQRLRLLHLALAGRSWCEIDAQELQRGGISYTIETVRSYTVRFPGERLYYLVGADHVAKLPQWREAEALAQMTEFIVIPRPIRSTMAVRAGETGDTHPPAAGLAEVPLPPPFRGRRLAGFPLGVSSSQIRARVKAGQSIDVLVPEPVAEAIRNNRLYL